MPFKLARFRRRKKVPETSHLAGHIADRLSANDDGAQMAAFIQSLHGARLGNINGSVLSNNHFTTVYNQHHAPDSKDYAEIKVRDIILKKELRSHDIHHELQPDGTLREVGRIRLYDASIDNHSNRPMLVRKYEGLASKDWKQDLDALSAVRHPNIIQLYGLCDSRHFTALIFHNGHQTTFQDYHHSLSGPSFVTYVSDLLNQYQSAADALSTQGLDPEEPYLLWCDVDHAGQLVVHTFSPMRKYDPIWFGLLPPRQSNKDIRHLFSRFNPNSFSKSSLEEYYDLLVVICDLYPLRSTHSINNFNASMIHQEGTTTLHLPGPYIHKLDNWLPEENHILCECLPDMLIRCTIPTSELNNLDFYQILTIGVQSTASGLTHAPVIPTLNLWASQVHCLNKQMKINDIEVHTTIPWTIDISCTGAPQMTGQSGDAADGLLQCTLLYLWFDCTPSRNTWWSTDPEGQTIIPRADVEDAFNISLNTEIYMRQYHIPQQIYPILWDIHRACGFNPESTEIAEYLGYPLLEPVLEPIYSDSDIFKEWSPESDNNLSDGAMSSQENSECGSDNDSENGSTSSDDTFLSANSSM